MDAPNRGENARKAQKATVGARMSEPSGSRITEAVSQTVQGAHPRSKSGLCRTADNPGFPYGSLALLDSAGNPANGVIPGS